MAQTVIDNVQTKAVGFAPILKHYFDKCRIAEIIDENVPLDPRRKVLSHGQASVAMITGILFQVLQLYRLCKFATETTVLETIFPGIAPENILTIGWLTPWTLFLTLVLAIWKSC